MAHAAEALYARDGSPVVDLMAQEGVRALMTALPRIAHNPRDALGRGDALYGCWLCGMCLGTVGMSLHHKLCHTLGGSFDLPHAETHAVICRMRSATTSAALGARERLSEAMGGGEPARMLHELARQLGAPIALRDIGMPEDGIDRAADLAVQHPYWNPRTVERDAIRAMLRRAWGRGATDNRPSAVVTGARSAENTNMRESNEDKHHRGRAGARQGCRRFAGARDKRGIGAPSSRLHSRGSNPP